MSRAVFLVSSTVEVQSLFSYFELKTFDGSQVLLVVLRSSWFIVELMKRGFWSMGVTLNVQ
jgi:hypothetical protein